MKTYKAGSSFKQTFERQKKYLDLKNIYIYLGLFDVVVVVLVVVVFNMNRLPHVIK